MRVSYNWLKDYVDIKMPAEKLAETLTMAGLSVESVEKRGDDRILEIEVTSNRPDELSYIGVAREVSALTGSKLKIPSFEKQQNTKYEIRATIKVEDRKLCPRYTARIIRNVKVGESPGWLKKKLEAMGLRPVNNIVDVTNFCLFETGEPMHAFDLDKLSGRAIIVRKASKSEKIMTIDGVGRQLDDSMLVIADSAKVVAIAGVMGGESTEVNASTKNILLEAAYFDPVSIRRTSRKLALSSESSYRFERKVDIENIVYASDRATQLILELAGGEAGQFIDIGKTKPHKREINLRFEKLDKVIGIALTPARAKNILASLGLKIKSSSKQAVKVEIPKFRHDLEEEIDLIEEIARIYGYDNIPDTIPMVVETGERLPFEMVVADKIRSVLASWGASEIITYSLVSRKSVGLSKIPDASVIEIKNPLSGEQEIMRPTLITGMLNSMRWNINRKAEDLKLFELGKVYFKNGDFNFLERQYLSIGVTGQTYDGWVRPPRQVNLFDLKGIVEKLFLELGIDGLSVKEGKSDSFSPCACAHLMVKNESLGLIGEIETRVADNFDIIKNKIYMLEIDCEKLFKHVSLERYFRTPPKYPSILRDISIVVDKNILNGRIISSIKKTAGQILEEVRLIDAYHGGQIPDGKTGLTYRLEYRDPDKTLEDRDVLSVHSQILRALENNLGAKLR